ncbi:Sulfite exporter TauE/SafE [uncultured archaeon]|nr:Sulfite exporter TauE/SafE [uncultured archaeon]
MYYLELLAPIIVLLSDISSSTTGIGIGIISTSYFSLIYPPRDAVLLGLYVFTISNIFILVQFREHIDKKFVINFIPFTIPGIILGTIMLKYLEPRLIRLIFGLILLSIIALAINKKLKINFAERKSSMIAFASIIGITSAFMNASSPFMVALLLSSGYSKKELVSTATACYFINNLMKLAAFSYVGIFSAEIMKLSLYFIPFMAAGILTGKFLIEKIHADALRKIIFSLLSTFSFGSIFGY